MSNSALFCAPACSIAAPNQGVSGEFTRAPDIFGHVELVQAGSGTLMILRHTAPLSAADKEKLERFSHSEGLFRFWRRLARYWKRYLAKRPGMIRTAYV